MERQKLQELYLMTSFLCFFVILIHTSSEPVGNLLLGSWQQKVFFLGNKALSFVVPAFIFLSGLKLTYAYKEKPFIFHTFFRKRFLKIWIPYFVWYIIYYIFLRKLGYMEPKTFQQHIFLFLLGDLVSPFYFITIIFQFYVLFGVIIFLFKKYNHKIILITIAFIEIFYLNYTFFPYEDRFFMTYLIYFILGCYFAFHIDDVRILLQKSQWIVYGLWALFTARHIWYAYLAFLGTPYIGWRMIGCMFSIVSIFAIYRISYCICQYATEKWIKIFRKVDGVSYQIFLAHCFILYFLNEIWWRIGVLSISQKFLYNSILVFPIAFGGCVFYYRIKEDISLKITGFKE